MPDHLGQRRRQRETEHRPADRRPQQPTPKREVQQVEGGHARDIPAPERDGRGLHADAQVVVAVDHRVFGVVGQHPEQVADDQAPGLPGHCRDQAAPGPGRHSRLDLHDAKGHRDAEAEGHAQHRLRHRDMTLGVGVNKSHCQRRNGQQDRRRRGGQHQQEGGECQRSADGQRLPHRHAPARDRALRGALDMAVEVAVGDIVDAAAGAAHQDGAEREDQQQMPARPAAGSDPERRQRGPEQQQPAGGPVPADQVEVERELGAPGRQRGSVGVVHADSLLTPGSSQA